MYWSFGFFLEIISWDNVSLMTLELDTEHMYIIKYSNISNVCRKKGYSQFILQRFII